MQKNAYGNKTTFSNNAVTVSYEASITAATNFLLAFHPGQVVTIVQDILSSNTPYSELAISAAAKKAPDQVVALASGHANYGNAPNRAFLLAQASPKVSLP